MIRYIDKTDFKLKSLEVSFYGMEWEDRNKDIPKEAEVTVRLIVKHNDGHDIPYKEMWLKKKPNILVPTGVWNGMKIGQITDEKVFVALGKNLYELETDSGAEKWNKHFADTAIRKIKMATDQKSLYVLYDYYKFESKMIDSNLIKLDLNGNLLWSAKTKGQEDSFTGFEYYNDKFVALTWHGWAQALNELTGEIVSATWSK